MRTSRDKPGIRRRILTLVVVGLLALVSLGAWGFASPVGSSPDDDFHLASIWCGDGESPGKCSAGAEPGERRVQRDLVQSSICPAFEPKQSARCQGPRFGEHPNQLISTSRGNFEGQYPPVYYAAMGVFAGPDIITSTLVMRIVNALLFVTAIAALVLLLPARYRRTAVVAPLAVVVPLGAFLIPSTNPSGWAILSASTLWLALVGYFESAGWRRAALGILAAVFTLMGSGTRSDSAVFSCLAIVVAIVLTATPSRRYALAAVLPAVLLAVSVAFYLSAGQSGIVGSGFEQSQSSGLSGSTLLIANVTLLPELWAGMFGIGHWGLGWLDTTMPPIVWVPCLAVFAIAVYSGVAGGSRRHAVALAVVFVAFVTVPLALLQVSRTTVGSYLQPRYLLPLAVILVGVALLPTDSGRGRGVLAPTGPQLVAAGAALALANTVALQFTIRRYVTGTDVKSPDLDRGGEWWWTSLPLSPMAVWIVGSLAFAGLVAALLIVARRRSDPHPTAFASH